MNTLVRHVLRQACYWPLALCALLFAAMPAMAQDQEGGITPNYKQADIRQVVEAVSAVTGKSFIVDPRVNAEVTMLSSQPMTPDAFYETFLSILEVYGYVAVENAGIVKILPNANVRQMPGGASSLSDAAPDDVVTRVIEVQNVGAAQLVPILRPLVPQYGHLAAHAPSNMLIISDRAANVQRMLRIIRRIDQAGDEEIEVVPLLHASATELVRVMQSLAGQPRPDQTTATNLVADERTNSILIGGERSSRLRLRALIAHLDTPLEDGGNMQVRYLRYANATELADKLQSQFQEAAEGGANGAAGAQSNAPFSIWADEQTNALIVTAPPKIMRSLMGVVDKLDIRRAQVLVEAIIVEVSLDNNLDLGVTWAAYDTEGNTPFASTDFPGSDRRTISSAISAAATAGDGNDLAQAAGLIGTGATFGLGRITDNGISFGAIISALAGDGNTNIISTPTIVTMDNEEARIEVGQEVPFVTGSFSNTGGGVNNGVNPFQTINRERVGTLLEITPQINEGDAILLNIRQETSSISTSAVTASDLITNERVIETSVIVDDGGILVLGGLIDDEYRESEQRVPLLGRIPILGNLFKATNRSKEKTNLMVFIRPKILRDGTQTAIETNAKYNYIRDIQLEGVRATQGQPLLPPVESYRPSAAEPVDLRGLDEASENP